MSRTRRANRNEMGRGRREPPGIKRLGELDYERKQAEEAAKLSRMRRFILDMRREHKIVTIGTVEGYADTFRFEELWAKFFPSRPCPSR